DFAPQKIPNLRRRKSFAQIKRSTVPRRKELRNFLQIGLGVRLPPSENVLPGRASALLFDTQDDDAAPCVEERANTLVPLHPPCRIRRHSFDFQRISFELLESALGNQFRQLGERVI